MGVLFLNAREICGKQIGKRLKWEVWHPYNGTETRETEEITMITHKKNGQVLIRHGKNNRQTLLQPWHEIEEIK